MFYTVLETQLINGTPALLTQVFTGENAEAASRSDFHTRSAAAAVSTIEYHSVMRLDSDGSVSLIEINDRRVNNVPVEE